MPQLMPQLMPTHQDTLPIDSRPGPAAIQSRRTYSNLEPRVHKICLCYRHINKTKPTSAQCLRWTSDQSRQSVAGIEKARGEGRGEADRRPVRGCAMSAACKRRAPTPKYLTVLQVMLLHI